MSAERIGPPMIAGEREMLRAFLDYHRATPEVEGFWFRRVIGGTDVPLVWSDTDDFQAPYDATSATRSEAFAAWQAEADHARRIEREAESLDVTGHQPRWGEDVSCGS